MIKQSLREFYLSLFPNLTSGLLFFIPKNEISIEIIEKLDLLKTIHIFNKVFVVDNDYGPMEYIKGQTSKHFLFKESYLSNNIFSLLEKKSEVKSHEFDYTLEKYFELVECLFFITNWMNTNITQLGVYDEETKGLFYLQSHNYKKHFEILIKNFYTSKEIIPKGNFNTLELIDKYLPDISGFYNRKKERVPVTIELVKDNQNENEINKPQFNKSKKTPLISEAEAEYMLLKSIFNLDKSNFK